LGSPGWQVIEMLKQSQTIPALSPCAAASFTEAPVWRRFNAGWRPLFGSFQSLGFSFEWHDFTPAEKLDWSRSFHPRSLELCLNLEGHAAVADARQAVELGPRASLFYFQGQPPLGAGRQAGERHRFLTVEYAPQFLEKHLGAEVPHLHPCVRAVVEQSCKSSVVTSPSPMGANLLRLMESLQECPVFKPAQETWFRCKALELAAQSFFCPADGELFCTRQQRAACERAARVQQILRARLSEPPALEELSRQVGCSAFHLSRQFSQATGLTIQQFLRQARLERAAELLRTGKYNVTEAALEVGYSSLSHFTVAFREAFGCCPGLYPQACNGSTQAQISSGEHR
jgi:AraC-like DNA-binding protein